MPEAPTPLHGPSGRHAALRVAPIEAPGVRVRLLSPLSRWVLRGPDALADPLGQAVLGAALPLAPLASAQAGPCAALRLGPDEWLLLAEDGARLALPAVNAPYSLVDVGHRNAAIELDGPAATELLAAGCPLDLDPCAFPPGSCTRTLFGAVEIVLWRPGAEPRFHIEVWRSFAMPLWAHLAEAAQDI